MVEKNTTTQSGFFNQISSLESKFWFLNVFQMLEKLAYWSVLLQLPVFTAQKGIEGGLAWEQWLKGFIFFTWAMIQNLTPFFFGALPDKVGQKKITFISVIIIAVSYFILGTQREFLPFVLGIILLGVGSGLFKPSIQGALSKTLNSSNSSLGWGIYFMMLNLSVIAAPPLSKYLRELSWSYVFFGSAIITVINLLLILLWRNDTDTGKKQLHIFTSVGESLREFINPKVFMFILCMSGFAIIYMQFYETLPNFIYDWSDTVPFARFLHLPDFMLMSTSFGHVISYEWLYNINSILVTLFVVLIAWLTRKYNKILVISIGILTASFGLLMAGFSMKGEWLVIGFIVYTFGEMITNPKFTDYLGLISPPDKKSMYLGYQNLSMAIGLGAGALLGGSLYGAISEKSTLALRYITEHKLSTSAINPGDALIFIQHKLSLSSAAAAELLWKTYSPWLVWIPFIFISLLSVAGLFIYYRKFR